ncbi:MAG TPA: ATP-grasp domain-containing protein [Allosphingosinicella sp.]|jgi:hypothetical protein
MTALSLRQKAIRRAAGRRTFVWFGTRATDALPLTAVAPSLFVVAQTCPLPGAAGQVSLEGISKRRVDLDRYDIDLDSSYAAAAVVASLLQYANNPSLIVAYRPSAFLGRLFFEPGEAICAFNFHLFQRQFEHKFWMERILRKMDAAIPFPPTSYLRAADRSGLEQMLKAGPIVARAATGAGGANVFLIRDADDIGPELRERPDEVLTVSHYLAKSVPINVNACIYGGEEVRVLGVSYQLIGVRGLTRRPFGFCGNDFAATHDLPSADLASVEKVTVQIGKCLGRLGYRGAFGADFLITKGTVVTIEINPRFQASSALSSAVNQALELPDVVTEHVGAFLDLPPPPPTSLAEQVRQARTLRGAVPLAQVFHRNTESRAVRLVEPPAPTDAYDIDGLPNPDVSVEPGAVLFRSLHGGPITSTGYAVGGDITGMESRLH